MSTDVQPDVLELTVGYRMAAPGLVEVTVECSGANVHFFPNDERPSATPEAIAHWTIFDGLRVTDAGKVIYKLGLQKRIAHKCAMMILGESPTKKERDEG